MPYSCTVISRRGPVVVLHVEPEQPDAEPFFTRDDFALALLLGEDPNALSLALGDDAIEQIAQGALDVSPFVTSVAVSIVRKGSVATDTDPIARYAIEVSDPKWVAHLSDGQTYESYAWSESGGPMLAENEVWEPKVRLPVATFAVGDRVSVHRELPISLGVLRGRGVVAELGVALRAPRSWQGGLSLVRIVFDHGPIAWTFLESVRQPPDDDYERAQRNPAMFFSTLLAMPPLERARALHFLGLRGGGASSFPPDESRPFPVSIEGHSARLYALLRGLPRERALQLVERLLSDWLADPICQSKKFGKPKPGVGLAAGDTIQGHQFECYAPTAFALGALTLLLAEHRSAVDGVPGRTLRNTLRRVPNHLFGYPGWDLLAAYPLAACDGIPPPLPRWIHDGYVRDASEIGQIGSWIHPLDTDLYRP